MSEETTEVKPLSEAAKQHAENIDRLAVLIEENQSNNSAETFNVVHGLIDTIFVRDGFLNKFIELDGNARNKFITNANGYLVSVAPTYTEKGIEKHKIGNYTSFLAALVYLHAGANIAEEQPDIIVKPYIKIVDALLLSADDFETEWSLTKLMQTARRNDVPDRIFYESVKAVSFADCIGDR